MRKGPNDTAARQQETRTTHSGHASTMARMDELEQVFPPSYFEQLSPAERERRESLLADIAERIHRDGPHTARPDPTRARQFMPFAALKE